MHLVEESLAVAEQERRLRAQFPGWDIWAEKTIDGVVLWHARPVGAVSKVVADMLSGPKLAEAVSRYQDGLPRHLAEVRTMLQRDAEAAPGSGMHRSRVTNLRALQAALGRLDAAIAVAEAEVAAAAKDAS